MKYSKDGKVCFDEARHTYLLGNRFLEGVTTLISRYKNKFDAEAVATEFAAKHGLNKDELLAQWKQKADRSKENGTAVHKVFESYGLTGSIEVTGNYEKEPVAVKFINEIFKTNRLTPVETEIIVYNDFVASQIDMIVKNSIGEYFIFDWKTNEKIETNGYNKFMLPPFNSYPDACFYHFSTQLSIYEKLCIDYPIKEKYIVHIDQKDYRIIKAVSIKFPDFILNKRATIL